jgi:hypothetical protein
VRVVEAEESLVMRPCNTGDVRSKALDRYPLLVDLLAEHPEWLSVSVELRRWLFKAGEAPMFLETWDYRAAAAVFERAFPAAVVDRPAAQKLLRAWMALGRRGVPRQRALAFEHVNSLIGRYAADLGLREEARTFVEDLRHSSPVPPSGYLTARGTAVATALLDF